MYHISPAERLVSQDIRTAVCQGPLLHVGVLVIEVCRGPNAPNSPPPISGLLVGLVHGWTDYA